MESDKIKYLARYRLMYIGFSRARLFSSFTCLTSKNAAFESAQFQMRTPCVYLVDSNAAREKRWPPPTYAGLRNVRVLTLFNHTTVI